MVEQVFERTHSFRDPIHGFIRVNRAERDIIDCSVFQRLRRVRQLGTSYLVYHGAEHTRFGHSLGVMEVATKVFQAIRRRRPDLLAAEEEWARYEQILRLAGLLHDVGHAPFSHASDEIFPREPTSGRRLKHEDYTISLIRNSELGELISRNFEAQGIGIEDVVSLYADASGLGRVGVLLQDIIAGELDADRMDYLARDSHYAGVSYGKYDLERLLDTVTAVEDEAVLHLAVNEGGLFALEEFLLARYYMFLQVYLNKHRRFYDQALIHVVKALLPDGVYPLPGEWQEFIKHDDVWLLSQLPEMVAGGNVWADCLYNRHHWTVVAWLNVGDAGSDQIRWMHAVRDLHTEFTEDVVVLDDARGKAFQRTEPNPYITVSAEPEERPKILILCDNGSAELVEKKSEMVADLGKRKIRLMRLYTSPDRLDEVRSAWDTAYARHG